MASRQTIGPPEETPPPSTTLAAPAQIAARLLVAAAGAALLVLGTVAVFATTSDAGSAALLAVGAALVFVAFAGDRLTRIKAGLFEAELGRAAALVEAADVAEASGAPELADRLRSEALSALQKLQPVARAYERTRAEMPSGAARTAELERLLRDARTRLGELALTPEDVQRMFLEGAEGDRVTALAAMEADAALAQFDLALHGIEHSRSAFEQYHALVVMLSLIRDLDSGQRSRLREALLAQQSADGWIRPGDERWALSESLLRLL